MRKRTVGGLAQKHKRVRARRHAAAAHPGAAATSAASPTQAPTDPLHENARSPARPLGQIHVAIGRPNPTARTSAGVCCRRRRSCHDAFGVDGVALRLRHSSRSGDLIGSTVAVSVARRLVAGTFDLTSVGSPIRDAVLR